MSFNEKFQEGESYGDAPRASKPNLLEDPTQIAAAILKDYVGARQAASLSELVGLIKGLMSDGEPSDDRKG
jgi:hypothetical protein